MFGEEAQKAAKSIANYCSTRFQSEICEPLDLPWFAEKVQIAIDAAVATQADEIDRLKANLDKTADGALVMDCSTLYCPRCNGEMVISNIGCFCDNRCFPEGADASVCLSRPKLR